MVKYFVNIIVMIFISLTINYAQSGSVVGKITDKNNGEGLAWANVIVIGTNLGTSTDLEGNFIIRNIPVGNHSLKVSYIGYTEKVIEIVVSANKKTEINLVLQYGEAIEGEEVIISAQASGQVSAINEQLASDRIINVVSAEKMEELPDANAAESIGRLPGISLQRSSGEANKVIIRGLSPKYNNVTIEGVKMASTNDFDRSVDLDIIQGEMLAGVEVSKSLQANMDADAIGGTVNLKLKEASEGLHFSLNTLGGYNDLNSDFGNYKILGTVSDRFFNNKFGARLQFSLEEKQLPSHRFGGNYSGPIFYQTLDSLGNLTGEEGYNIRTQGTTLTDQSTKRKRNGGSVILDYKSDFIDIKFYNLYNNKIDDGISRYNNYNFITPAQPFSINISKYETETEIRTHSLQNKINLFSTELRIDLSYTYAQTNTPQQHFNFREVSTGSDPINQNWLIYQQPATVLDEYGETFVENSYLEQMVYGKYKLKDENYFLSADWDIPFNITNDISCTFSLGSKYHKLERKSDNFSEFIDMRYGAGRAGRTALVDMFPWIETNLGSQYGVSAINFIDENYDPGDFLNNRYQLGWSANVGLLKNIQDEFYPINSPIYQQNGLDNYQQDYSNTEEKVAGYIMAKINVGNDLMILPGLRYEKENTTYNSYHIELLGANRNGIFGTPDSVFAKRDNEFFFPSVNLKYSINDWSFLQAAVYKSTSRPDFRRISPLVILTESPTEPFSSGNPYLKPSTAWNYDLGFSVFNNEIGLLGLNLFYKEIDNFIFVMSNYFPYRRDRIVNAPDGFIEALPGDEFYPMDRLDEVARTNIPFNSFEEASYKGIEISWQTNFWYLPGLLSGLVLDVNLTFIDSKTKYPYFENVVIGVDSSGFFPRDIIGYEYRTRSGEMVDQPDAILNLVLGWDYKGFSSRFSFRYQDKALQSLDTKLSLRDSYYDTFTLVDISLKQRITENLSIYSNLTNIGLHIDDYFIQKNRGNPSLPTNSEYYGFRAQVGINYNL